MLLWNISFISLERKICYAFIKQNIEPQKEEETKVRYFLPVSGTTMKASPVNNIGPSDCFEKDKFPVSSQLIQSRKKWTLQEIQIFYCLISMAGMQDKDNWLTFSRTDLLNMLRLKPRQRHYAVQVLSGLLNDLCSKIRIRDIPLYCSDIKDVQLTSMPVFTELQIGMNRDEVKIRFYEDAIPVLSSIQKFYTRLAPEAITTMECIGSPHLYALLNSSRDRGNAVFKCSIAKKDLWDIFGLGHNDYGQRQADGTYKINWSMLEKRVLLPAVKEINRIPECRFHISMMAKAKTGRFVMGYDFYFLDLCTADRLHHEFGVSFDQIDTVVEEMIQGKYLKKGESLEDIQKSITYDRLHQIIQCRFGRPIDAVLELHQPKPQLSAADAVKKDFIPDYSLAPADFLKSVQADKARVLASEREFLEKLQSDYEMKNRIINLAVEYSLARNQGVFIKEHLESVVNNMARAGTRDERTAREVLYNLARWD